MVRFIFGHLELGVVSSWKWKSATDPLTERQSTVMTICLQPSNETKSGEYLEWPKAPLHVTVLGGISKIDTGFWSRIFTITALDARSMRASTGQLVKRSVHVTKRRYPLGRRRNRELVLASRKHEMVYVITLRTDIISRMVTQLCSNLDTHWSEMCSSVVRLPELQSEWKVSKSRLMKGSQDKWDEIFDWKSSQLVRYHAALIGCPVPSIMSTKFFVILLDFCCFRQTQQGGIRHLIGDPRDNVSGVIFVLSCV